MRPDSLPCRGLFVTGTDTGVGKTTAAVAIVRSLRAAGKRVGVYKPVASGIGSAADPGGDPWRLWEAAGRPASPDAVCPQAFPPAVAPRWAAAAVGRVVDESLLRTGIIAWQDREIVVVEAAGGLFSPLAEHSLGADLARDFGYPLVIVDAARLGAVGRTLATIRAARADGMSVAACVLSHVSPPRGDPADVASDDRIAAAAAEDLRTFLPDVPVTVLGHAADRFQPPLDWWQASG